MTNLSWLSCVVLLPFVGMLFVLLSQEDKNMPSRNAFHVAIFTVLLNMLLLCRIFYLLNLQQKTLQLVENFVWLDNPKINIVLGIDVFSAVMLMSLHFAILIGIYGIRRFQHQKGMLVFTLFFLSLLNGFFVSGDIFSFYIFFEAQLFPLFMLIGMYGGIKREGIISRFFLYNFMGSVVLFLAFVILYNRFDGLLEISKFKTLNLHGKLEYFMLTALFVSFLSRIPIWPFHYWISSISANIRNPLVFIIANVVPLSGLYGFMRFLPESVTSPLSIYISALEVIAVVTMLFIALIGFTNKDIQYKFFSYMTVYYIIYLLSLLNDNDLTHLNIAFSCFSYLIIIAVLELLADYLHFEQEEKSINPEGSLCAVPKLSFMYSFFILAAIGLPVSSLFLNNFLIISNFMQRNLNMGLMVVFSLTLVSASLLKDLYRLKDRSRVEADKACIAELSSSGYLFLVAMIGILAMSAIKPLWFLDM